ncbi:nuclear transport factor 2 family protein [Streptomyces sp. NBC_00019]|uniref:nuclear transport factor 2 family protein n=1 Tax=Streptomyces sp. NBC_00019 TaxID=2975623 RepID=UPI002F918DEB
MDTVDRLAIIEDIRRVMARYVHHADRHRWHDLAGLFTPDATFTPHRPDGSILLRMEGRDGIEAGVGSSGGPDDILIHHLFSDEIDVESATSARGVWAMEDIVTRQEVPARQEGEPDELAFKGLHGYGHYHGRFVKVDGTWYIAQLEQTRLRLDFTY